MRREEFPFATSVIYYLGSHFLHVNYKIIWNAAALGVWEGTYLCSTCDLNLHHTTMTGNLRNKTESHPGKCLRYLHKVYLWNIAVSFTYSSMFKETRFTVFTIAFTKLNVRFKKLCVVKDGTIIFSIFCNST